MLQFLILLEFLTNKKIIYTIEFVLDKVVLEKILDIKIEENDTANNWFEIFILFL